MPITSVYIYINIEHCLVCLADVLFSENVLVLNEFSPGKDCAPETANHLVTEKKLLGHLVLDSW